MSSVRYPHAALPVLLALAAIASGAAEAQVVEYERDAAAWMADAPCHESCAFDRFLPGLAGATGCLPAAPLDAIVLELAGGTVTITAFDGGGAPVCAIGDAATAPAVSDGTIVGTGSMLVLEFDPPVVAFYTYYGSLAAGATATMRLYQDGVPVGTLVSAPSPHDVLATGHGFTAPDVPVDRIEITSGDPASTLVGAFTGLVAGESSLGTTTMAGYDGPGGSGTVPLDFSCMFDPAASGWRIHNLTARSFHACIRDAIAQAQDGDVLEVQPSSYRESIDLEGKAITIRSVDPDDPAVVEATILDPGGVDGSVVTCASGEGPGTVLDGLAITGGTGTLVAGTRRGGGLYLAGAGPTIARCVFVFNLAADRGGAIHADVGAFPTIVACDFLGNGAAFGGAVQAQQAALFLGDCRFDGNASRSFGGAVHAVDSAVVVEGGAFTGNQTRGMGGAFAAFGGSATMTATTFAGNHAGAGSDGGAVWIDGASAEIVACEFADNVAHRGAAAFLSGATPGPFMVSNCRFLGNAAGLPGAGGGGSGIVVVRSSGDGTTALQLTQSIFSGNRGVVVAADGGSAVATVSRCSIVGNAPAGSVSANASAQLIVRNSILWGNGLPEILETLEGAVTVQSCTVEGTGDPDPLVADPDGADDVVGTIDDDLRLTADSPAIDAGIGTYDPREPEFDFDGLPRHLGAIDHGAFEYPVDCDGSGTPDYLEIADGLLADCNQNLFSDACESVIDCNANGIIDECDIASGLLTDANANGFPDECEVFGTIAGDVTWDARTTPVLLASQDLLVAGTLTVQPGVVVRFADGVGMIVLGGGHLEASGEPDDPAQFTSSRVAPAAGDWDGLRFAPGSSGDLSNLVVEYARTQGVRAESADVAVQDCVIREIAGLDRPNAPSGAIAQPGGPAFGIFVSGDVAPLLARNRIEHVRGGRGGAGPSGTSGATGSYGQAGANAGDDGESGGDATSSGGPGGAGAIGGDATGIHCGLGTMPELRDNVVHGVRGGAGGAGGNGGYGGWGGDGGGGASFDLLDWPPVCDGGAGGAGGDGSAGGGGGAGAPGGAAFGIRLDHAAGGAIHQNVVVLVEGGAGGAGGSGAYGGAGGAGGDGGVGVANAVVLCTGDGPGDGGDGGDGGEGGDGGIGAAGGPATGVAVQCDQLVVVALAQNTVAGLRNGAAGELGAAGAAGVGGAGGDGGSGFFYDPICHCIPIPIAAPDGQDGFPGSVGLPGVPGALGAVVGVHAAGQVELDVVGTIVAGAGGAPSTGVTASDLAGMLVRSSTIFGFAQTFGAGTTGPGVDNQFGDPLLADVDAGDVHLLTGSPCIDAGDDSAVPPDVTTDLDGDDRFIDGDSDGAPTVDMGADEYGVGPCPADLDGDDLVGFADVLIVLGAWDATGVPADLDGGGVGFSDLLIVLGAWGACP